MKEQIKTPVFQEDNGTWSHLTKLVNPLICTIEYGRRTGFSSREEAEESYQRSLVSYQDQLFKLKKDWDMPFTFSEYLDYWLNDVCAQGSNGSRTLVQKQWTINLIIQPHLHKDILLGCVTPDYLNKVLESCQAYCCNGGYYAYKLLHSALKHARVNNCLPDMDFQQIRHYPEPPGNPVFYSPEQLRTFLTAASNSNHYLEIQLALFCGLTPGEILGLKYSDFNRQEQTVTIQRICTLNDSGKNCQLKKLEGVKQNRSLKIPSFLFSELSARRKENRKLLTKYPSATGYKSYLCLVPTAKIKSVSTLGAALKTITTEAGLPRLNMRDLRYMFARFLLEQDFSLEAVSDILGHTKQTTTLAFCNRIPCTDPEVGAVVAGSLDPVLGAGKKEEKKPVKKNENYPQMPVKETFLYGRLISGKSLGDVIYIKTRRKYCFRLLLVFESGDVKMVQRTASSNKQLARQERDTALMEIAKGSFIPFSYTVKEFYDFWFYHYMIGQKRIAYNTYNAYRNIIENYLLPKLGHKKLEALQKKDLVKALSGIPHPGVLRTAAGVVTASLCYARKHNYLSRDIYTGISSEVKRPCLKKKADTRQVYTVEQATHFLYLCKQQEPMIYLPMLLAVTAGLRISEITGLRYSDIDFLGRKLFVERQLGKDLYMEVAQESRPVLCSELPLKTKNSKRTVVLADFVLDEILLERQRYEKRKASDPGFLDLGYICCYENGQCHNRSFYIKPYNRLMEQSGISQLPWRKFRNTYATILAQYQVNMKTISKCLGHYSPDFTNRIYVASQKQETYDISKIIEEYVLAHHLLPKEQGSVEPKRQCNVEQKPYLLPEDQTYRNYFYD